MAVSIVKANNIVWVGLMSLGFTSLMVSTRALLSSSTSTQPTRPYRRAWCRAVLPWSSVRHGSAPLLSSHLTVLRDMGKGGGKEYQVDKKDVVATGIAYT